MKSKPSPTLLLHGLVAKIGLIVDAKSTSTSGRWVTLLGSHLKNGLPCFDVVNVRADFGIVQCHHFSPGESDTESYDVCRDKAKKAAREFYEEVCAKLSAKPVSEEADEGSGLVIENPDGSTQEYIN